VNSGIQEGSANPSPIVALVVLLLLQAPVISHDWGLWLRQTENIRGKLWHRYTTMVNQFMVATVQLSM